jgi:hypothetical protein
MVLKGVAGCSWRTSSAAKNVRGVVINVNSLKFGSISAYMIDPGIPSTFNLGMRKRCNIE